MSKKINYVKIFFSAILLILAFAMFPKLYELVIFFALLSFLPTAFDFLRLKLKIVVEFYYNHSKKKNKK
ncbi:hypothetical protein ERHA55_37190 [Erwinia rhapontici]|uniref:Uncharacterized protein n=1 Tax=Erwinia rhapontici TaxID=55212 RepID=A0ABM7N3I6_ERWRD|nr:hypothetical protein ERHA53_33060 [Erwinia rhapontici]BCQ46192.1 hypothetical protein ERHA55_37190 [Erwinia rhapontici]